MDNSLNILLYYFPNEGILNFMVNDLFLELKEMISIDLIYSEENKKDSIRTQNRNKVEDIIVEFFNENPVYISEFKKLYQRDFIEVIDNIIESFTFSVLLDEKKTYKDKKSIAYTTNPSPFDIFKKA